MPWQSLYNFKPSASKRKDQQPTAHPPDAPVNTQLPDPYGVHAYAPDFPGAAHASPAPAPEHHSKPQVTFGPDVYPSTYAVFALRHT